MIIGDEGLVRTRPFRTPHHSSSHIALIGGGSSPQPGEISLAHNGILFLDELPEFKRHVLEVLRQPLEEREIQEKRFAGINNVFGNSQMGPALRRQPCVIDRAGQSIIRMAMERLGLSARAYDRILKVARTIADLEQCDHILASHVAEAVNYRNLDREGWSG